MSTETERMDEPIVSAAADALLAILDRDSAALPRLLDEAGGYIDLYPEAFRKLLRKRAEASPASALALLGSHQVAEGIVALAPLLSDDELRDALRDEWTRCDAHGRVREELLGLFRRVGYVSDCERVLAGTLTVYRGNLGEDARLGIAWTLDEERARFFAAYSVSPRAAFLGLARADGEERDPTVWRGLVEADDVLGYFEEREESEVVLDPSSVRELERVASVRADHTDGD